MFLLRSLFYITTSRLIIGLISVLLLVVLIGLAPSNEEPPVDNYSLLFTASYYAISSGLLVGFIDRMRFSRYHRTQKQNESGILFWIFWGLKLFMWIIAVNVALIVVMPLWLLRSKARNPSNDIQTFEVLRFSWTSFRRGFRNGFIIGLVIGLVGTIATELFLGDSIALSYGLFIGVVDGLLFGLIGGLISCIKPTIQDLKTTPNQGIKLAIRTTTLMGGLGGLVLGVIGALSHDWPYGIIYGALGGLCIGLWYGGLDVIQHFIVRFLLWRAGSLPWRLAPFLDYAAEELNFLQKVGGGYIFVHRYLLEHFATMDGSGSSDS